MRLELDSLTVRAFRGIRGEERFQFDGEGSVIVGPNGSGKSTILQALEFLLIGEISALTGSGTGGIRKTEHVPNRYADASDTAVQARFTTGEGEQVRVVREFDNRSRMQASSRPESLRELVRATEQGLLLLTRDELLELVVSTPGTRKDQIYQIMDTGSLDTRRKQLKRLRRNAATEVEARERRYADALETLRATAGPDAVTTHGSEDRPEPEALCAAVNELRTELGGEPLDALHEVDSFQRGLTSPLEQASNPLQRDAVLDRLETLRSWIDDGEASTSETLTALREELRSLRADEDALDMLAQRSLVEQGRQEVDGSTTTCPLCGKSWEAGALQAHLQERSERLAQIDERVSRVESLARRSRTDVDEIHRVLDKLVDDLNEDAVTADLSPLGSYREELATLTEALAEDLTDEPQAVDLSTLGLPGETQSAVDGVLAELESTAAALPDRSRIERMWGDLQTLDEAYGTLRSTKTAQEEYRRVEAEFERAHELFLQARDDVLGEVFDQISDRFASIYTAINPDESTFDPSISQTNTGVDFSVGFYESGQHPPHALHSEGHQDLMGVSLFLALAAELSPLDRHPLLLDDVVMSVDDSHRRQFARVLAEDLSDQFQLLVTTHDAEWARQLVDAGVATDSEVVRFQSWDPTDGPVVTTGL
jgi:DNA repair exonuclease SbcCD ATPase subunit